MFYFHGYSGPCPKPPLPRKPSPETAEQFLNRSARMNARVVSSGDLSIHQIAEAQANRLFWVDEKTNLGWAILPFELTTTKDRHREADYFGVPFKE